MNRNRPFLEVPPNNDAAEEESEPEIPMDPFSIDIRSITIRRRTRGKRLPRRRFRPHRRSLSQGNSPRSIVISKNDLRRNAEEDVSDQSLEPLDWEDELEEVEPLEIETLPTIPELKIPNITMVNPTEPQRRAPYCNAHQCPYAPLNTVSLPSDISSQNYARTPLNLSVGSTGTGLSTYGNSIPISFDMIPFQQPHPPMPCSYRPAPFPVTQSYNVTNCHSNLLQTHCHTMPITTHVLIPLVLPQIPPLFPMHYIPHMYGSNFLNQS